MDTNALVKECDRLSAEISRERYRTATAEQYLIAAKRELLEVKQDKSYLVTLLYQVATESLAGRLNPSHPLIEKIKSIVGDASGRI